jgi:hypothetical protein
MIIIIFSLISVIFTLVKKHIILKNSNSLFSVKLLFDNKRISHILTVLFCELLWLLFSQNNILILYVTISFAVIILFIVFSHTIYNSNTKLLVTYLGKKHKVNNVELNNDKKIIRFILEDRVIEYTIYNKKWYNIILSQISNNQPYTE